MEYPGVNTFGQLISAPDGKIIEKIFSFVSSVLQDFIGKADDNENHLTNELCKLLGFKKPPELPFFFQHQNIEDSKLNTSTDFAVFGTYSYAQSTNQRGENFPLVTFEAKRLSTTIPKKREREYVIGEYENGHQTKNSGGIERFKNLRHGKDVDHAGIIGYVQTDSFKYWFDKVNYWIKDEIDKPHDSNLLWDDGDYLTTNWSNDKLCSCLSNSKRKDLKKLNLNHIWVNLT